MWYNLPIDLFIKILTFLNPTECGFLSQTCKMLNYNYYNNKEFLTTIQPYRKKYVKIEWTMDNVARKGILESLIILHNEGKECTIDLHIVEFLHNNRTEGCATDAMDYAAENGHLHVVEWLHNNIFI